MNAERKPLLASDRVRLYLTLVPYLLERRYVPVDEAAAEFGVTAAQLRKMVETLTMIGLPDDGYVRQPHENLFDIDWDLFDNEGIIEITHEVGLNRVPRFTAREAAALLAGLQVVAAVPTVAASDLVSGLLDKLSRAASATPLEVAVAPPALDAVRDVVASALRAQRAVSFTYQAVDAASTTRTVDPVRVLTSQGDWYLQGWCHLRQAMRTFHLDRISDPQITDIAVTHLPEEIPALFAGAETEGIVEITMPAAVASILGDVLAPAETVHEGDKVTARLRMADPRAARRIATRFGGQVVVTSPNAARAATREWAKAGLALYCQQNDDNNR